MNDGGLASNVRPNDDADLLDTLFERHQLLERLTRIQRSISHGAPLQEVLDAITQGAAELLGDEVVGLRLIDDDDPEYCLLVSVCGVTDDILQQIRRTPVRVGAGGRAIHENQLIVMDAYYQASDAVQPLAKDGLQSAMAAPVHEKGKVVGSLVVASYTPGRTYSSSEKDALLSLAEHASLALADARMVERLRQAQREREMFLAMASHGLKTPLTVITGSLLTLLKHHKRLSADVTEGMLQSAFERTVELESSISKILEGTRGQLASSKQDVFLPDLIVRSAGGFDHSRKMIVGDVPAVSLRLDAASVVQILGVLLENAVSHSPESSEIRIGATLHDGLCITVENEGSLPESLDTPSLFMPFQRGPETKSRGVGLGLYIALQLAQVMGGTIEAQSEGGRVLFAFCCSAEAPTLERTIPLQES